MAVLMKPGGLLALICILICPAAIALADAPGPTSAEADPFAGHAWELTAYLKGTAEQIRDEMNGESERLIVRIKQTQRAVRQAQADTRNDEKIAVDAVRKTPVYQQTAADMAKAQADLEVARKSGSSDERMEASSRFNKARLALEKMEIDAMTGSEDVARDRQATSDAEKELKRSNEALVKATAWREELLDATRNGFMLKSPLIAGAKGTLPRITVEKRVEDRQVLVGYDLLTYDTDHPEKEKEGIQVMRATKVRIHVLVSDTDTTGMKVGDALSFDRVFVMEGTRHDDRNGTIYLVKPFPSDADKLFEAIVPLRESLTTPNAKGP